MEQTRKKLCHGPVYPQIFLLHFM